MATHIFTRRELYDLVWSEPMMKLAERFNISGNGLAKACKKANIPVPPRGYWAKVQAGKKVIQSPLPDQTPDTPWRVTINPMPIIQREITPPKRPESVEEAMAKARRSIKAVKVAPKLTNPHKLIARWLKENKHEREEGRYGNLRWKPDAINGTSLQRRRLRILSAMFHALEDIGCSIQRPDYPSHPVEITFKGEALKIDLSQRIQQKRRKLTEEEKESNSWYNDTRTWTVERFETDELILKIKHSQWSGTKAEYRETDGPQLEEQLTDVVVAIAGMFEEMLISTREKHEAERRRWAEAEERRKQAEERQREELRFQKLLELVEKRKQAEEIREFVNVMADSKQATIEPQEYKSWADWARRHADRIDPMVSKNGLDCSISDHDLLIVKTQERNNRYQW